MSPVCSVVIDSLRLERCTESVIMLCGRSPVSTAAYRVDTHHCAVYLDCTDVEVELPMQSVFVFMIILIHQNDKKPVANKRKRELKT